MTTTLDSIPRHDMEKIRDAWDTVATFALFSGLPVVVVTDAISELELLRRNEQLAANFAARADEVRKAAQAVVRAKSMSEAGDGLGFRAAVSLLLTAVLGPEVWRDGEIARDGTQALTINEEET